jgi:YtoQ family protein
MNMTVYLAGEIHSDWRAEVQHAASDDCGVAILGAEEDKFWHDRKGALLNAIRTRTALEEADVVVVRFGEKYKQWNAAFDAGYAAALGRPLIILHPPEHDHALKEVDAAANAVARTPEEVAQILRYVVEGRLP